MESLDTTVSNPIPFIPESHTTPVPTTSQSSSMEKPYISSPSRWISSVIQDLAIASSISTQPTTIHSLPAEVIIIIQGNLDLMDSLNFSMYFTFFNTQKPSFLECLNKVEICFFNLMSDIPCQVNTEHTCNFHKFQHLY